MNVDAMRRIDRWIGAPVCAGLTVWDKIFFSKAMTGAAPRNVLIIQLSEMGSIALAYPSARRIKQRWPEARLHFLLFKRNRKFLELLDFVAPEDIWMIDDSSMGAFLRSSLEFRRRARERPIDTALDYEMFSRASMILSWMSGARRRAGFYNYHAEGCYRGGLLTHPIFYNVYKHVSLNFMAMVEALAADPREQPCLKQVLDGADLSLPRRPADPEKAREMRERIRQFYPDLTERTRIVVLSPYSGNLLPIRAWPAEHYAAFTRKLLDRTEDTIALVIGLPEARDYCRPIFAKAAGPRLVDFIGRTKDIADVVDLLQVSHLLVCGDSGPPHFASLTHCPAIVIFGPECPMMYAPLNDNTRCVYLGMSCSPCVSAFNHRSTPCTNPLCVKQIEPQKILGMALEVLNG
ncbi:MAG: glycosyltransferase family 9 protein [Candidatus Sumerlaeota bacterium]|nr:glycosyltransferase family 9 protein [Candidatus Sumerlaeota bacterium]